MTSRNAVTIRNPRAGMTLLEILVAMIVLLIGIFTVARGFPLLLQSVRGEGDKTAMSRLAEEAMARLSDNQSGLPEAITGGGSVSHYTFAQDMTAPHTERNAQEDIIEVRGETFRVPAPYRTPGGAYTGAPGWYALGQGPAAYTAGYPAVYMLVPLQERFDDPRDVANVDYGGNWFYVDKVEGQIVIPLTVTTTGNADHTWNATNVVTDYAWTTIGAGGTVPVTHYVQGETPSDLSDFPSSGTVRFHECRVHPKRQNGGVNPNVRLVTGQTRVWARVEFGRNVGSTPPAPG
ncbi:MAG: type II secretion system protein, partial [Armatimonadota bacterium]